MVVPGSSMQHEQRRVVWVTERLQVQPGFAQLEGWQARVLVDRGRYENAGLGGVEATAEAEQQGKTTGGTHDE